MDIRAMVDADIPALTDAMDRDTFHPGEWTLEHFTQPNVHSNVIEDAKGPIAFVRFTKTLRISCVWNDAAETSRNAKAIIYGIKQAVDLARASGYTEVIIQTSHEKLAKFLSTILGMKESKGEFLLQV